MKIIHTSDWHLGRSLYGRKRYQEAEQFLNWLAELVERENIDALLVAGDIFDTSTPSNRAQEIYYRFLCRIAASPCRHVIIIAGNHDSPSFLTAPREILRILDVHIVGSVTEDPADEVLVLKNPADEPELIVCAVPYLRDRDIRKVEAGENPEDKEMKMLEGIGRHYQEVYEYAEKIRHGLPSWVPLVVMGHLFTNGGLTVDNDGVRELYVGSLARVNHSIFHSEIDYLALGHLHVAQQVGGMDTRRYSGSPIPMGFGEAKQEKMIYQIDFTGKSPTVRTIPAPCFQALESLNGDWTVITERLEQLKLDAVSVWLEVVYDGDELISDLRERLEEAVASTKLEVLRVKNKRVLDAVIPRLNPAENLEELNITEVFLRCLESNNIPPEQQSELLQTYAEAAASLNEGEPQAE